MADGDHERAVEKLAYLIGDIRIAMLTTFDGSALRSRPMMTQQTPFDGTLWFFTSAGSLKAAELRAHPDVNLAYASTSDNRYVSISGHAALVRDPERAERLWNPLYRAWFPKGLDDPDVVLLKVEVERAEYWDADTSRMTDLVGLVKAVLTGKAYEAGEHRVVMSRAEARKLPDE